MTYPGAVVPLGTAAAVSDSSGWFHLDAYDPYADATKSSGALFYWRFEEQDVVRDHGIRGDGNFGYTRAHDGTYVNTPTCVTGPLSRSDETAVTFASASSE